MRSRGAARTGHATVVAGASGSIVWEVRAAGQDVMGRQCSALLQVTYSAELDFDLRHSRSGAKQQVAVHRCLILGNVQCRQKVPFGCFPICCYIILASIKYVPDMRCRSSAS